MEIFWKILSLPERLEDTLQQQQQQQQHFIHSCTAYIHLNMEKRTKLTYNY